MSEFGWTRLAYLTVVLTVLAVLVKLGTFGVASISENLPESVFAFAQREPAAEQQYQDEKKAEKQAAGDPVSHNDGEHAEGEHADDDRGHSHEPVESLYENVDFKEDPPIFYRPAPQVGSAARNPSSSSAKSCETLGDAPPGSKILFPMTREHFDSYEDTWGAARPQGGHEGTDLMVPNGTPLLAMTDARVVPVSGANPNGWNTLGGYTAMLEAAYSVGPVKKGDLFYYAHMDRKSELRIGDTVEAGDVVGYAGDTGQGPEGARGQFPPHLHLGWYETSGERTQLASGAMNPYPLLEWVKANGGSIEGGSDIPYCEAPQSSAPTPSGGGYWQFPSSPGVRPDMSTETGDAVPSPVVEQNDSSEFSPDIVREPVNPVRPNRPATPAPSEEAEPDETGETGEPTTQEPPSNGMPSFPNPLPGIGGGIGDLIDGILNPGDPEPSEEETTRPTRPATPPEEANPKNPEDTIPETTTPEENDTECEPHEPGDDEEESNEKTHLDEDCHEETTVEEPGEEAPSLEETSSSEEETTDETTSSEETVEEPAEPSSSREQYESRETETTPLEESEAPAQETTFGP